MAALIPPRVYTVHDAMVICGMADGPPYFDKESQATRFASDVFDDDFESCMDKTITELEADMKSYAALTQANGQIRLTPGVKKRIKAFIQWSRDMIRVGIEPSSLPFPHENAPALICRMKTHEAYVKKASTISDTAKPSQFTSKTKWEDWNPVFINFLRSIPGRNGVPLSYICREEEGPTIVPGIEFIDDYVNRAPLAGPAFVTDSAEVNTYIVSFIAGNSTAEAKILGNAAMHNGRLDYISLKNHYEGTGVNAIDIVKADKVLDSLYYAGEKKPHMWWEEFEKQLTLAFNAYNKKEHRQVHSNEMRLRILCRKVTVDFLQHTRASINIELTREPMTMTYEQALSNFRNEVNRKFPPEMGAPNRTRRNVNEIRYSRGGRGGRFGRGRGRERFGRGGNSYHSGDKRPRTGSRSIMCNDGQTREVHPAFSFSDKVWSTIPQGEKERLLEERRQYKANQTRRNTSAVSSSVSVVSDLTPSTSTHNVQFQEGTKSGGSIMGGRNEQANFRSRNNSNN